MPIGVLDKDGNPVTIKTIDDLITVIGEGASPGANTLQARIEQLKGFVDGVETLVGATNTALATLNLQTDTLEALIASTNTKMDTLAGYTDGLETLLAAAQPAGEYHIGEVGGNTAVAGGSFNRPANTTPYASGQLVANTTTAGSVTPIACAIARKNAGTGVLTGLRLSKSGASLTNASFRVHLFKTLPTTTAGDGATFAGAVNGVASIALGYVDVTLDQAYSDGAKGFVSLPAKAFDAAAASPNLYALIEARATYTPASGETFTLALEGLRD